MDIKVLYRLRVFSVEDVMNALSVAKPTAAKILLRQQARGLVRSVRRNMYTAIDPGSDRPVADRYEIAAHISPTSYIGWHSALEFHGLAQQVFFKAYVGNHRRFSDFTFDGTEFAYCASPCDAGVISPGSNPEVRVTDLERTLIDCCDHIDRAGGPEELMHSLEGIVMLDEDKLCQYLEAYHKAFLYQKVGFILERIKGQAHISDSVIELCRKHARNNVKRLTATGEATHYVGRWKLYVPEYYLSDKSMNYDLI